MKNIVPRPLLPTAGLWLCGWAWVGWRGHELTEDAKGFINAVPPGATIPEPVLASLEAGQAYIRGAVLWGIAAPVCLALVIWIALPAIQRRRTEKR
jgi:hypothetical protein